ALAKPTPVFQYAETVAGGEIKNRYVQFVDNQETTLFPALCSVGSYGFNYYVVKRGSVSSYPVFVVFEGGGATFGDAVGLDADITDCYILGVDDWLPIPNPQVGGYGDNTHYCCYHEDFNIYSTTNPVPTTGTVKMYTQQRYIEALHWLENNFPIDKSKV